MSDVKIPPIGLLNREIYEDGVKRKRFNDVAAAIARYYNAGLNISVDWIQEYNELVDYGCKENDEITKQRVNKVYIISLKSEPFNINEKKIFLNKDSALEYWEKMGKNMYGYMEKDIYE